MTVSFGNDHAGFPMRSELLASLRELGHIVRDNGTATPDPVDFPDVVSLVCNDIRSGKAERGLLLCGTGVGASIAANKFRGIRASVIHDWHSAHQSVEHDDLNVMCLGAQIVGPWLARDVLRAFLDARFAGTEEFTRRIAKIAAIESGRE